MLALYNKITERLSSPVAKQAYQDMGVIPCKYIDIYRGQYDNWEDFDTMPMPAVLFDYNITHEKNKSIASITLHICYELLRDTSSISRSREKALRFFNFIDTTRSLLADIMSDDTGKLQLISEEVEKNNGVVDVHLISYECTYYTPKVIIEEEEDVVVVPEELEISTYLKEKE